MRNKLSAPALGLVLAGCGSDAPTVPHAAPPLDPSAGLLAFEADCASCHPARDGFDLAFFGFPASDIVRRGVAHVDTATAKNIAAYVESLGVEPVGRFFRPFQPHGESVQTDSAFWRDTFGTDGWPDGALTVEWLRELDLRDVPAPLPFPLWSVEGDNSDWLPAGPLPDEILDAADGAVREALEAYHAAPGSDRLLALIERFQWVTRNGSPAENPVCAGSAAAHARPLECFEARRWVSALAAIHLLREGEIRDVPYEVAELWWDSGEAAVSIYLSDMPVSRTTVAAWLYMSSIFAPDGFPGTTSGLAEEASYMGSFLQSDGRPRLAVLATLRRMVSTGPLHHDRPKQAYWDLLLATIRAPRDMFPDVLELGLEFLLDEQAEGRVPTGNDLEPTREIVDRYLYHLDRMGGSGDAERDARIRALVERVSLGLSGPPA